MHNSRSGIIKKRFPKDFFTGMKKKHSVPTIKVKARQCRPVFRRRAGSIDAFYGSTLMEEEEIRTSFPQLPGRALSPEMRLSPTTTERSLPTVQDARSR